MSTKIVVRSVSNENPRTKTVSPISDALRLQDELRTLGDQLFESMCNKFGADKKSEMVKDMREISDAC